MLPSSLSPDLPFPPDLRKSLTPLRIAIVQPVMHWSGDDNTKAVLATLGKAASAGAQLCLFPELVVTGFHRQIAAQAQPALVDGWLRSIEAACAQHGIAASVGAPTFDQDLDLIFNSQIFIDPRGQRVATVHKTGLTDPEATFFTRGDARSVSRPVVTLLGQRISAVICREIEDLDRVCMQWAADTPNTRSNTRPKTSPKTMPSTMPQIIVWPGLMAPDPAKPETDPPAHVQDAKKLARRSGAYVLQANWPMSLNYPELGAKTGGSVVIGPDGKTHFTLPQAAAGLAVFSLGATHFEWHADET